MMTARSSSSGAPRSRGPERILAVLILAVLILAVLVAGCVPPPPEATVSAGSRTPTPQSDQASRSESPLADPGLEGLRDALGQPGSTLAELALDLARRVDFIRHEVPRGDPQREAVAAAHTLARELDGAIRDFDAAMDAIDREDHPAVFEAARGLEQDARSVRTTVAQELSALAPHLAFDAEADEVVAAWGARGSRQEYAAHITAVSGEAAALVRTARRLPLGPAGCVGLRTNRIGWAERVAERTEQLREVAVAAQGNAYDELRERFGRAPYGEDRVVADSEVRPCWAERTALLTVPDDVQGAVGALEDALDG